MSLRRLMRDAAMIKRAAMVMGKRGDPQTHIPLLHCTPLDVVDAETAQRLRLDSPYRLFQTFVDASHDIKEGDLWVHESAPYIGQEMAVRSVANWDWDGRTRFLHVILEDVRE